MPQELAPLIVDKFWEVSLIKLKLFCPLGIYFPKRNDVRDF